MEWHGQHLYPRARAGVGACLELSHLCCFITGTLSQAHNTHVFAPRDQTGTGWQCSLLSQHGPQQLPAVKGKHVEAAWLRGPTYAHPGVVQPDQLRKLTSTKAASPANPLEAQHPLRSTRFHLPIALMTVISVCSGAEKHFWGVPMSCLARVSWGQARAMWLPCTQHNHPPHSAQPRKGTALSLSHTGTPFPSQVQETQPLFWQ